jgi:hypothetical protein
MKNSFIQKKSFLLLLGGIVVVSANLVYLFTAGNAFIQQSDRATTTSKVSNTPITELSQLPPPRACNAKQRHFQMGVAFPQWGPTAYGEDDTKWLAEMPVMHTQTGACWIEMPLLFSQSSLSSTTVTQGPSTPSVSSFNYGLHFAHDLGFHIFVTPLLQVNGSQPWSGAIQFATSEQEQHWFESYWQAIKPYAVAAAQASVEQLALGTEYEWLQDHAPDSLWNTLIRQLRSVFPGTLTYDMNWTSLPKTPPSWMHNANLKMIGVSAYLPLIATPERVDPKQIFHLWKQTVKRALDDFALKLGEPIFISEVGYRNSADALYHSWEPTSSAPPDPEEQAAACDAALANIIPDQHLLGSFFWAWDDAESLNLKGLQAATVIHSHYKSLQA